MFGEFKRTKTISFNIDVNVKWECPDCGHINVESYSGSPYRSEADDAPDVDCKGCKEFYKLNFYKND